MKKIILIVLLISGLYSNEQKNKEAYDITEDKVYNGCRDVLADKLTNDRYYVFGLAVAKKDTTLDMLRLMSMRVVNGVDEKAVCKWFLDFATGTDSSKYINSLQDSTIFFLLIVERSVVQNNGETYEQFSRNIEKMKKLFKK